MNAKVKKFKLQLANVFDDDLTTIQWRNVVDYTVIFFILLSTIEVVLSTFDPIVEKYGTYLTIVDWVTTIFFTVEVSLRIWTCGEVNPAYRGWRGKLRYCFSFYGLLDILATFPFYFQFFTSVPYLMLKTLRVARLMRIARIFRYAKSLIILKKAFNAKKHEMWVSMQFLLIVTFILAIILYYVEHDAQPDAFPDGLFSLVWAVGQYLQPMATFIGGGPVTLVGKIIVVLLGIMGIAMVAVPAGLIGSAFVEVMDEENADKENEKNRNAIYNAFKRRLCRFTKFRTVPRYLSLATLQAEQNLSQDEVIKAVELAPDLRLRNLAQMQPTATRPLDNLVVEHFPVNTDYGCLIDRKSKITIISTSGMSEGGTGSFAYYLAKIGGFNYIAKELPDTEKGTYFQWAENCSSPAYNAFMRDLHNLTSRPDSWAIAIFSASFQMEPVYPEAFHFVYSNKLQGEAISNRLQGSEVSNFANQDESLTLTNLADFNAMYQDFSAAVKEQYDLLAETNKYYRCMANNICRHCGCSNAFNLRIDAAITVWDLRYLAMAQTLANAINAHLEKATDKVLDPDLTVQKKGFTL